MLGKRRIWLWVSLLVLSGDLGRDAGALLADATFSHDRGCYTASFEVTISAKMAGACIQYTQDGSDPRNESGHNHSSSCFQCAPREGAPNKLLYAEPYECPSSAAWSCRRTFSLGSIAWSGTFANVAKKHIRFNHGPLCDVYLQEEMGLVGRASPGGGRTTRRNLLNVQTGVRSR